MTRSSFSVSALLAPVLVSAVPWIGPQPTIKGGAEIDAWSPAPTSPPLMYRAMNIFEKRQTQYDNTCGYVNGDQASSFTCINTAQVCATNSDFGVHGCCDPRSLDNCAIPTTCYAASQMSSCTGDCLANAYVARCTMQNVQECYNLLYDYGSTTMTEWGCNTIETTIVLQRTYSGENVTAADDTSAQPDVPISTRQISTASTTQSSAAPTSSSADNTNTNTGSITSNARNPSSRRKSSTGAIAGGVVGGIAGLALIVAAIVWLVLRNKKKKQQQNNAADIPSAPAAPAAGFASPPMQQNAYPPAQYPHGAFGPAPGAYGYAPPPAQGQTVDYKYAQPQPQGGVQQLDSTAVGGTGHAQPQVPTQMLDGRPVGATPGAHELA